jgi:hypothetical protein
MGLILEVTNKKQVHKMLAAAEARKQPMGRLQMGRLRNSANQKSEMSLKLETNGKATNG